ncbi:MAG TPA: VWA domain-containing protein [Candidatus Ozemobacteraceae bacterium]
MTKFRRLMLLLLGINILLMACQAAARTLFGGTDEWLFNPGAALTGSLPVSFEWILALWLAAEVMRLILFGTGAIPAFILLGITLLLASIAGPMVGSITDQSRSATMGYAVGGAKDAGNFRANIENGYLPLPTDLTFEGLFYDYSFETGKPAAPAPGSGQLFVPTYRAAVSRHPVTGETETYLSVGLDADLAAAEFRRGRLNLVVVLDVSGSMGETFDTYYYDRYRSGEPEDPREREGMFRSKLEIACAGIVSLLKHLNPDDRLGLVVFDSGARLFQPLRLTGEMDLADIARRVVQLRPGNSTNLEAGLRMGCSLLTGYSGTDRTTSENRVLLITDAQPNTDDTSESGLLGIARAHERLGTHLTFVGVGVDFNTRLVESLTKIRGANYHAVHSAGEFARRLDEGFDQMVTPLVFDLTLSLESTGWAIARVYGSPETDEATGEIMRVSTLFPSMTSEKGIRGGLVLLKLRRTGQDKGMRLRVAFEDRSGRRDANVQQIVLPEDAAASAPLYDTTGIRKGILLARYGDLIHEWILQERGLTREAVSRERRRLGLSSWERCSEPLRVSRSEAAIFRAFRKHFADEACAIGDPVLKQELAVLDTLIARAGS